MLIYFIPPFLGYLCLNLLRPLVIPLENSLLQAEKIIGYLFSNSATVCKPSNPTLVHGQCTTALWTHGIVRYGIY